jgi:hypothetical protein
MSHRLIRRIEERPPVERQSMRTIHSESDPPGCIFGLEVGFVAYLLLIGTLLAYVCFIELNAPVPALTKPHRLWPALGMVTAICLILDSLLAALFLLGWMRWCWYGALLLSLIGIGGSLGMSWAGYQFVVEATRLGGDTGPLRVVSAWLGGVILPFVFVTIPLGLFTACLFSLRAQTIGKGEISEIDGDLP